MGRLFLVPSGCQLTPYSPQGQMRHFFAVSKSAMVARHHDLGQAGELVVDRWPRDQRTEHKLRDAYGHVGVDTPQDRIGRGPGGIGLKGYERIDASHQRLDLGADIVMAEMKGHDGAVVI